MKPIKKSKQNKGSLSGIPGVKYLCYCNSNCNLWCQYPEFWAADIFEDVYGGWRDL